MIELKPLIFLFVGISFVLLIYMLIVLFIKQERRATYVRWTNICNNIINNAIYSGDENFIHHQNSIDNLLLKKTFRKIITKQIIFAAKNFSGKSFDDLKKLYNQLQLDKYALENIRSKNWHVRAKTIQEIGNMKLEQLEDVVLENTNHKKELVRSEAQISIIKLVGFNGLKFLDKVTYPISEWYQIILLRELSQYDYDSFNGINTWLKSENNTVVIFALKLVDAYHLFQFYNETELCLHHESKDVRKRAIKTISKIFNSTTSQKLFSIFNQEEIKNKLEIVKAIQEIGTDKDLPFLINQLNTENIQLKLILTKTIAVINPNNFNSISSKLVPNSPSMDLIIAQVKEETNI